MHRNRDRYSRHSYSRIKPCLLHRSVRGLEPLPIDLNSYDESTGIQPHPYCQCAKPLVERLPVWNTAQCGRCGREIDPSMKDDLIE